jgi:ParB family chromosome partitioning protein
MELVSVKHLENHPLADMVPRMGEDEYSSFADDIETNGLRVPIELFEGKILDGRHRYDACIERSIAIKTHNFEGDEHAARLLVLSLNLHRRSLTTSQRALLANAMATGKKGVRKTKADGSINPAAPLTQPEAAKAMGVSPVTVKRAKKLVAEAPKAVVEAVRDGKTTLNAALKSLTTGDDPSASKMEAAKAKLDAAADKAAKKAELEPTKDQLIAAGDPYETLVDLIGQIHDVIVVVDVQKFKLSNGQLETAKVVFKKLRQIVERNGPKRSHDKKTETVTS